MTEKTPQWILYNPNRSWFLGQLSAREARVIIKTLSFLELKSLLVTREKETEWYRLDHPFCEPIRLDFAEFNVTEASLPSIPVFEDEEITSVQDLKAPQSFQVRRFQRVEKAVPIEIFVGSKSIKTTTADISEGGIRVKDVLPDWVAGYFAVTLNPTAQQTLEVHCSIVEDQKRDRYRIEIVSLPTDPKYVDYCLWIQTIQAPTA